MSNHESNAEERLFEEYSQRLIQLASQNIHPSLLRRFNGEDVVQSVFRTLFRRIEADKLHIEGSQQLWKLLVKLTLCKTRSHARTHTAQKRDAIGDQSLSPSSPVMDGQPLPEDALALREELDLVLARLPNRAAEIVAMRLEGRNRSEIAQELNLSRQTIHRILRLTQQRLEQRFDTFLRKND